MTAIGFTEDPEETGRYSWMLVHLCMDFVSLSSLSLLCVLVGILWVLSLSSQV